MAEVTKEVATVTGVRFTAVGGDVKPVFTLRARLDSPFAPPQEVHGFSVGDEITIVRSSSDVLVASEENPYVGEIFSVPSDTKFTLVESFDTSGDGSPTDPSSRTIEYNLPVEEVVEEVIEVEDSDYEWAQITLGQNDKLQEIASTAGKASSLLNANLQFVKVAVELGKVLLLGLTNPQLLLLIAIADEIDNFMKDFVGTGFFILEVTPTGMEVTPSDAEGNPVLLALSPFTLSAQYAAAAAAGLATQFQEALAKNGIVDEAEKNGTFNKSTYKVPIGKSLGDELLTKGKDGDVMSLRDGVFGLSKMTPSQVIATIIAAMDDPDDDKKPEFSDSADVAAVIVIIGFADLTKDVASLKDVLDLFVNFFGGENGLFTKGIKELGDVLGTAVTALQDTETFNSEINVTYICGIRGTSEDRKILRQIIPASQWNENASGASRYYYNFPDEFEVGDLVVASQKTPDKVSRPVASADELISDDRAMGYVSKVETTDDMVTLNALEASNGNPYVSRKLTISCLSRLDKLALDGFGQNSLLQKVAYVKNDGAHVDQNSMEIINDATKNGYKLINDLNDAEAGAVAKVIRESGNVLLKITGTESVTEEHGPGAPARGGIPSERFKTKNLVQGFIAETLEVKKGQAPPPNFKPVRLIDLIAELGDLVSAVSVFTNTMRDYAADAIQQINELTSYLDTKIEELEELNDAIQSILRIFTTGLPDSGVYSLSIPSTSGGNNAIKDALANATNGPPNSLDYSVGFMMMGGAAAIDPLLSLISGD